MFLEKVLNSPCYPTTKRTACCSLEEWERRIGHIKGQLHHAVPFEVSNVAAYLYEGTEKEEWDHFHDFPRPLSPFHSTWFEWRVPRLTNSNGKMQPFGEALWATGSYHFGALISTEDPPEELAKDILKIVWVMGFIEAASYSVVTPAIGYAINRQFDPCSLPGLSVRKLAFAYLAFNGTNVSGFNDPDEWRQAQSAEHAMTFPALLSMSFLNCRNVVVKEVATPPKLVAKHKKHGHPLNFTSHRIIEIQPMTKVLKAQGCSGHSRQAAGIMRGHFKDYRMGAGLFGKHKGLYWWDQRLNGSIDTEYRLAKSEGALSQAWPELLKGNT